MEPNCSGRPPSAQRSDQDGGREPRRSKYLFTNLRHSTQLGVRAQILPKGRFLPGEKQALVKWAFACSVQTHLILLHRLAIINSLSLPESESRNVSDPPILVSQDGPVSDRVNWGAKDDPPINLRHTKGACRIPAIQSAP